MAPHPGPLPASGERGQECSWLGEPGGEAVRVELLVQSRQIRLADLRARRADHVARGEVVFAAGHDPEGVGQVAVGDVRLQESEQRDVEICVDSRRERGREQVVGREQVLGKELSGCFLFPPLPHGCAPLSLALSPRGRGKEIEKSERRPVRTCPPRTGRLPENRGARAPLRSGTGAPSKRPRAHACARPALVVAKSAITDGVAVSKPTTSSMPASFGSAIVNPFDAIPITTSFAPIPIFWRYAASAWVGWMSPAQVSLSV